MRIAICDDEKEIRDLLGKKIQRLYPQGEIALYASGEELLLSHMQPDILLLDIQMPGKNGMETAKELRERYRGTILIFITGLEDFVFQAFDVGAFHYLVKPFEDERLFQILQNAVIRLEEQKNQGAGSRKEKLQDLVIQAEGKHFVVSPKDIVYAEVFNRKVIIHTIDSDIEYYGRMKELVKKAGADFYRPHRSYLVNFNYIRRYDASVIDLKRGQALIAKQNYQDFVKCYLRFIQRKGKE